MSETTLERPVAPSTEFTILGAASFCHLLNDMMQALLPAIYPILRGNFNLSFAEVGLLTLVYQLTASILQPLIGFYTDKHPKPYSLPFAMIASLLGLVMLAFAPNYTGLLAGAAMLGLGSSIFHPESSRIARLASGGAHGLAQSLFQVGGNFGSALGPLVAAYFVLPRGQHGLAWIAIVALGGVFIMTRLGQWYKENGKARLNANKPRPLPAHITVAHVWRAMAVLVALIFSKYIYLASITNYYTFYLMHHFHLAIRNAQLCQFVFFAAVATGTVAGGPIGDRLGRKVVIWFSILGILPFTLALPYVGLGATIVLSVIIGVVLASAFPAIVVYAQELIPGRTGLISGMFFGLIFGVGGIAAAILGSLADSHGIDFVYHLCSFLPLVGLLTIFLPSTKPSK
ncbi:MFS transporter [Acetobacter oryzoeni]|uniref:MFS transporter n=1 Tax=Acetobacter oryzoeni TaxID=2500548 RepID=UPI001FCB85B6|nr:MFS transporter [Acetobacter oryzoeni]MCP1203731.1 MFS transporter [Acetobacter oryzoeni]